MYCIIYGNQIICDSYIIIYNLQIYKALFYKKMNIIFSNISNKLITIISMLINTNIILLVVHLFLTKKNAKFKLL